VARLRNEQTGQYQVAAAGIGMSGTAAAGEFITNDTLISELRNRIGARFKENDFEVVLSTDVTDGIAGTPKVVAVAVR
jgi:hypothetical protein